MIMRFSKDFVLQVSNEPSKFMTTQQVSTLLSSRKTPLLFTTDNQSRQNDLINGSTDAHYQKITSGVTIVMEEMKSCRV
jgi:hypothetical protein